MLEISDYVLTRVAQEAERRRIARELHDGASQSLSALVADFELFRHHQSVASSSDMAMNEKLEYWEELARASLLSMRQTLEGLRAHGDPEFDLLVLIRSLLADMRSLGYEVTFDVSAWPSDLPFIYSSHLYYCIHEAMTNIRKHAHATDINIFLFTDEETLNVSVIYNGVGLPPSSDRPAQDVSHQGLISLQERVSLLGGRLLLTSEPDQGTRVDIAIPQPH